MIRSIAQLKAWFRRGKYPTEEQFSDLMDSYVHREESQIPIAQVTGLPEQLNGKYAATAGVELERQHGILRVDFDNHKTLSDQQFDRIGKDIIALEDEDERLQGEIDELNTEVENIHQHDAAQDVEITALHGMDNAQQDEIDTANLRLEALRKRLHLTVAFGELETAFSVLGTNYSTLYALAVTLKTFLEANDTADSTINRWQEIETFLQGITDTSTLSGLLEQLEQEITAAYGVAIAGAVAQETTRAQGVESALQGNIVTERTRAQGAETALGQQITATKAGLQQTDAEIRQDIAAVRQTVLGMLAESAGRVIPLVMNVTPPRKITLGNPVRQYITAKLLPSFAVQNVLFLGDGKSVDVDPDGAVTILGLGQSRVHVIPTENTALHQTVTVEVVNPSIVKASYITMLLLEEDAVLFT